MKDGYIFDRNAQLNLIRPVIMEEVYAAFCAIGDLKDMMDLMLAFQKGRRGSY